LENAFLFDLPFALKFIAVLTSFRFIISGLYLNIYTVLVAKKLKE